MTESPARSTRWLVTMRSLWFGLALACACSSKGAPSSAPAVGDLDVHIPHATPSDAAVAVAPDAAIAVDAGAPPPPVTATSDGHDFIDDAKLLYRVAGCGPIETAATDPLAKVVERHCKALQPKLETFRAAYFGKHRAWFDAVVPKDIPKTVVYPFGGGDLLSALVAFPDATEITTISLELAGDPRRLPALSPRVVEQSLGAFRAQIGGLVAVGSNTSENLSAQQRNELPGQVSSFLLGLVTAGYEPVAMRYFTLAPSGDIDYLDLAEIEALDKKATKSLKHDWLDPNFSEAFSHVEIRYRKAGDPNADIRVHRHLGWNLGDAYLKANPQLIAHLEKKGKVTLLTKGASYLLWGGNFSTIRSYMLRHLAWMLSDSTGIPPAFARAAKLQQITYGTYTGAFLEYARTSKHDEAFIELWAKSPRRRLGFRFGYVDMDQHAHVVVTRPK